MILKFILYIFKKISEVYPFFKYDFYLFIFSNKIDINQIISKFVFTFTFL